MVLSTRRKNKLLKKRLEDFLLYQNDGRDKIK
jgi:hypothetical protein